MINIRKLEAELWESADLLRQGSKLTSSQYCMPVLALLFLRYAYSRYKMVEAEILENRPSRGGRVMPVEPSDFAAKSALYLPREAQFDYLVNLPDNIVAAGLKTKDGQEINSLGEAVNNAMQLVEDQSEQLTGVLPKTYTMFADDLLRELLRIFNNKTIDEVGGDIIGRIYEYFLSKFAKAVASDDGVFFTPKSLVKMLVNVLEPTQGVMLEVISKDAGQRAGAHARSDARPCLWFRWYVRTDGRLCESGRIERKHSDDFLRTGKGGIQRTTLSDEHGCSWFERPNHLWRRSQLLLSRCL